MPNKSLLNNNYKNNELSSQLGVSELLTKLLFLRGITTFSDAKDFLYATLDNLTSPFVFKNMEQATWRIKNAIKNEERIVIYGDYDCDGVGAIAILYLCFRDINKKVNYYIPNRANEGYGINLAAIDKIKEEYNPDLIITVDCGATSVDEISYIKSLGIDIIVTDHHICNCTMPDCLVINPCMNENVSPLCGAGMAFMLSRAVFGDKIAFRYLDICAISTIADIVPLVKDNRIIAKFGLEAIKKGNCRYGIKDLAKVANVDTKNITSFDIGYKIAPRLNSSGRLDTAYDSLYLLIEEDRTATGLLSEQLNLQNMERQNYSRDIFIEAMEMLKDYDFGKYRIIVLCKNDWQEGVIGIVSSKVSEYFNLPVILLTSSQNGDIKGSARSIEGINIADLLEKNSQYLNSFGGHSMAAGLSLDKYNLDAFVESINNNIINTFSEQTFKRTNKYDIELSIKEIKLDHLQELSLLEPFGHKNCKPVFCDSNFTAEFSQIGSTNHIKARAARGDIISFNGIDYLELFNSSTTKSIVYTINKNYFKGRESNQFLIKNFYANDIETSKDSVICRMLSLIINANNSQLPQKPKSGEQPNLFIAYSKESFSKMLAIEPNIDVVFYKPKFMNVSQTLVFCPDENFPYHYYKKITILDNLPKILVDFLASFATIEYKVLSEKVKIDSDITVLREDYLFISSIIAAESSYFDMENFYKTAMQFGYNKSKLQFYLAVSIFIELKLLNITNNDIICSNHRVKIEESSIYEHFVKKME